jgi:UDP-glucose 4-epimerase
MNLLITGCASHIARTLIPVLLDDSRVTRIIGVDLNSSAISHSNYQEHNVDIRSEQLEKYFADIDAVIHLAFITDSGLLGERRFDRDYIRDINVNGSKNVFQLATAHQVKSLIHFSSAIVYGMSADNPQFLEETQPLKPVSDFYYSEDKVAVEQWIDEFEQLYPAQRIVRLRPHIVLGQYAQPLLKSMLSQPFHFMFPDPQPLTQCISEMDVATAVLQSLFLDVNGSFNLATDQVASFHWIHKHLHNYSLPIPFALAQQAHKLSWRYSGRFGDPAWFACMKYPLTISNDKAKQELNWKPTLDLFECLEATL